LSSLSSLRRFLEILNFLCECQICRSNVLIAKFFRLSASSVRDKARESVTNVVFDGFWRVIEVFERSVTRRECLSAIVRNLSHGVILAMNSK